MRGDDGDHEAWQEDDVRGVPARQRQRADRRAALQYTGHDVARARREPRDVDRDDCRPIRALIPWQEVSRQREREDQPQQRDARQPRQLSWPLVGAERDDPQYMQRRGDNDEARAEVMEPANEAA